MAVWIKKPIPDSIKMQAYFDANLTGVSASYDMDGKLQELQIDGYTDDQMGVLMGELITLFPSCF